MIQYALGLATLPALYVVLRVLLWAFDSTNSWRVCGWCGWKTTTKWDRLKAPQMRLHDRRKHRATIAAFKAAMTESDELELDDKSAYFHALRAAKKVEQEGAL